MDLFWFCFRNLLFILNTNFQHEFRFWNQNISLPFKVSIFIFIIFILFSCPRIFFYIENTPLRMCSYCNISVGIFPINITFNSIRINFFNFQSKRCLNYHQTAKFNLCLVRNLFMVMTTNIFVNQLMSLSLNPVNSLFLMGKPGY